MRDPGPGGIVPTRGVDLRHAAALCLLTVAWNAFAGSAAVISAIATGSLTLSGFGLNAAIDSVASLTLVWRFRSEDRAGGRADEVERRARVVVGWTLLAVAAYLSVGVFHAIANRSQPAATAVGTVVAIGSLLVLPPLAVGKGRLALRLGSEALHGDSVLSGVGAALAAIALLAVALSSRPGWRWVDAAGALVMAAVLFREGLGLIRIRKG